MIDCGEVFIDKLIHNYERRGRTREGGVESLEVRTNKLEKTLEELKIEKVWRKLQGNRRFRVLTKRIKLQIDKEYENRLKFK